MELDLIWILIGLPAAFGLGWLASRLDLRQLRIDNRQAPRAYFKGLNFLLNEQQDKAIDAFIEAVQNDPDTSELHFALGNLFRRRGEYERAVRVHEHLLSRGDLSTADRQRAQNALAKDYVKAGLLDRAEDALKKLEGTSFEGQARLARLAIYERSREWPQARAVAEQLELSGEVSFSVRKAHYLCEQARELNAQGDAVAAAKVVSDDKQIDEEFRGFVRKLITYMAEDPKMISTGLDLLFIAKAIERVGDHAKNIAEFVIYIVKGADVRHISHDDLVREATK